MLEIGRLVDNKYRILDIVGKGGMSVVYLARNERANKSWAIKEVRKVGEENLEVKKNSLMAETEMLKKLSHPNLPTIVDVIETNDTYLVVMDYIEGNDLGRIINEYGAQSQEKVVEWGKQLCDVLGYLHTREQPIIYRDLKPANIMLKPDGNIMLIDFGTAREVKVADAADTISLGTRGYAAPEQFGANAKTDARTDIYCLGATMYHLVTNHNPSTEPYVMEPIRKRNPSLSVGLEKIILKCTQPNPSDRYQSCAEVMYALEHYDQLDERYRRKQINKLILFFASIFMVIVSLCVSAFGFVSAENKKAENIDTYIVAAEDETKSKDEREKAYRQAISLDPANYEYYKGLLDLYLMYDDSGNMEDNNLSMLEVAQLKSLESLELYDSNNVSQGKIASLEQLKKNNIEKYREFCKDVGISIWYYCKTSNNPEAEAAQWFKMYLDSSDDLSDETDEFVEVYYSIGECKSKQMARSSDIAAKYDELWSLMDNLYSLTIKTADSDSKVLGCKEIVDEIEDMINEEGLALSTNITQDMLLNRLEDVESIIRDFYPKSGKIVQKMIDQNFTNVKIDGSYGNWEDMFEELKQKVKDDYR